MAAEPPDGVWQGGSTGTFGAGCYIRTTARFAVREHEATGEDVIPEGSAMPAGRFAIRGMVAGDGGFAGSVGAWPLKGRFSGDSFEGDYEFGGCTMIMRLRRAG